MAAVAYLPQAVPLRASGIDHVQIPVRSYRLAKGLYRAALAPLGYSLRLDWPDRTRAYFGAGDELSSLWLVQHVAAGPVELALAAPDRRAVDAFYAAALAAGASPRRDPGAYAELTAHAYGAAVADGDGNVIEAIAR
jgi:catechol 2,3-dioxygenase-like lactoylglutathione lyase family enzyme